MRWRRVRRSSSSAPQDCFDTSLLGGGEHGDHQRCIGGHATPGATPSVICSSTHPSTPPTTTRSSLRPRPASAFSTRAVTAGDNFADFGIAAPDFPVDSPLVTAVGGTSLEVNSSDSRAAEYGWSTGKQTLCGRRVDHQLRLRDISRRRARLPGGWWWRHELLLPPAVVPGTRGARGAGVAQPGALRTRSRCACSPTSPWTPTRRPGC